jgi:hypothetical protein
MESVTDDGCWGERKVRREKEKVEKYAARSEKFWLKRLAKEAWKR